MYLNCHNNANPNTFENARTLKRRQTTAEKQLWRELRNRKLSGHKFRRQHPVGPFIVDFYCHSARLVVELDGTIHDVDEHPDYDADRTRVLEAEGLKVIRFRNEKVMENLVGVLKEIEKHLQP